MSNRKSSYKLVIFAIALFFVSLAASNASSQITVAGSTAADGPYTTLGGAFTAINGSAQTGNVISISVSADTTEGVSAILNAGTWTSVTISPTGGGARTISGAIAGHLVDLNGADNVKFDGLNVAGNALTISNTSTAIAASTIRFIADATNNTVTNSSILGATGAAGSSGFGVIYFATGTTTGNDGNQITNNNISSNAGGNPINGIYSFGTSTAIDNSGITISGNNISDYFNAGGATSGINVNSASSTWTITNNRLFQTATRTYTTSNTHNGINVLVGSGYTITGNTLGYANSAGTGTTSLVGNTVALAGFPTAYTASGTANATRYIAINGVFTAGGTVSNIQNNTVAGYALYTSSGATTTTGIFCGICVTSGNVNIGTTSGNSIGTASSSIYAATTTSGGVISGIYVTSANTVNIQNNTIQNLDSMGTTASVAGGIKGIEAAGTVGPVVISSNTVGNATNPNLRMGNLTTGASLSNIGTTFGTATGLATFQGILNANSGASITIGGPGVGNVVRNANLNSTSTSTSNRLVGISSSAGNVVATDNSVSNLTTLSGSTSAISTPSNLGISVGGTVGGQTIARNTVQNLSNTNATAAVVVTGIYWGNSSITSATNIVERNLVQNNTIASSGAAVLNGIYTFNGAETFRNNMILLGTDSGGASLTSGALSIAGFREDTLSTSNDNFFNNSVLISGTGVGAGTASTFAHIRLTTTTLTDVRNNIYVNNRSNGVGTGKHYILNLNALTAMTLNYNLYNQTGVGAIFGVIAGTDSANFPAWQTATSQEVNSSFADPLWVSATNLHLTAASPARDTGFVIASVTNDFDGKSRPGANALYDRGADEFDGILPVTNDVQATAFIDPLNGGVKLQGSTFSPQASFTNNGTASQTNVPVRYRICSDVSCTAVIYNQTATIPSLASIATATVTFPSTSIATAGNYFIRATAELVGDTVPANNEIAGTLTIAAPLAGGTYTVGAGGNYTSLTNPGGIFDAINNLGATGNLIINITSNLTNENGTVALNEIAGGFTVLIKPSGVARSISGTSAVNLIKLNGADGVTIDGSLSGGADRSLTINITGNGAAIWNATNATSGANNNTFKNLNIAGDTPFTAQGILSSSGTTFGAAAEFPQSNNTILNNSIIRVQNGAFISGNAATFDQNWIVQSNAFGSATVADKLGFRGVILSNAQNMSVTQNVISGVSSSTGTSSTMSGIQVGGVISGGAITRNEIRDIKQNNTTGWGSNGIYLSATSTSSNLIVANNFVSDVASQGFNGVASSDNGYGIMIETGGGYNIYYNSVSLNTNQGAGAASGITAGINIAAAVTTVGSIDLRDNIFANTQTLGTRYAIYDASTAGNTIFSSINNNDYFAQNVGFLTSARVSLANWQTASGQDGASISADPLFTSATDLRTLFGTPVQDKGVAVSVLDDIDGNTRSVVGFAGGIPDIGAKERLGPTAAGVSIAGRVTTENGAGIKNAAIVVTGNSLAQPIIVKTASLGYYSIENLQAGETYVVTVNSKRFTFQVPSRVISLTDSVNDIDFVADPLQ